MIKNPQGRWINGIFVPYSSSQWAYTIAKEVEKYPTLIDPDLYAQAKSYSYLGRQIEYQKGYTPYQAAQELKSQGKKFSGYSKSVVFESLYNFEPGREELEYTPPLPPKQFGGPEWAKRWNKAALINKYVKSVGTVPTVTKENRIFLQQPSINRLEQIGRQAHKAGLASEWKERLLRQQPKLTIGVEDVLGRIGGRKTEGSSLVQRRGIGRFMSKAVPFIKEHKLGLGIGTGLGLLYLTRPLSIFSGKDDQYNTIEGLPHGGQAENMRRILTDFGSGYQGDNVHNKEVQARFDVFTKLLPKYGEELGTGHKRILIPKSAISEEDLTKSLGFVPTYIAIPETGQSDIVSYRNLYNLYHLHEHGEAWTMHRDEYAASTMLAEKARRENKSIPILTTLEQTIKGLPHVITEGIPGLYYYLRGQAQDAEDMSVRLYRELSPEYKKIVSRLGRTHKDIRSRIKTFINKFSGKDDHYNTIEGLKHGGLAEKKRKEITDFGSGLEWIKRLGQRFIPGIRKQVDWSISGEKLGAMPSKKYNRFFRKYTKSVRNIQSKNLKFGSGTAILSNRNINWPSPADLVQAKRGVILSQKGPGPLYSEIVKKRQILEDKRRSIEEQLKILKENNQFDGFQEQGFSKKTRGDNTGFGSKFRGIIKLFRGTGAPIATHTPIFGKSAFTPVQKLAEQVLERVRSVEFKNRPSRLASTFWTPSFKSATKYAEQAAFATRVSAAVSRTTTKSEDVFLTKTSHVNKLLQSIGSGGKDKNEWLKIAREYWEGVDINKIKSSEYSDIEALFAKNVESEKVWEVERVLKQGATIDRPAYKMTELMPGIDKSKWYAKHKEAVVRVAKNTLRPGSRHTNFNTGKIVQ